MPWPTFWTTDSTSGDWLIEPLLPRGASVALYAQAGLGKSEVVLCVSAFAATGRRILGRPAGNPLTVAYLDFEQDTGELMNRLLDLDYGPESDLSHLIYFLHPALPPLDTAAGGKQALQLVADHQPDLVVIDTLARVLEGPENDSDTLRAYHRYTGQRLKAEGVTVLRIDHTGKDVSRGQRGTSAKNDDVDLVWKLDRQDAGGVKLTAKKRRLSWVPEIVKLERHTDPLRYELVRRTWPNGTVELANELDRLDIPLEAGRPAIRKLLRAAGITARNETLSAAIRWRHEGHPPSGDSETDSQPAPTGTAQQPLSPETAQRVHGSPPQDTPGQGSQALGVSAPPPRGALTPASPNQQSTVEGPAALPDTLLG